MKKCKILQLAALAAFLSTAVLGVSGVHAATLDEIFGVQVETIKLAQASQERVDTLSDETSRLLANYKTLLKEIDGLRVYNGQLQRQINNQNREKRELNSSIERVTLIERQITPLMIRMIDGLEQFIELDSPFLLEERRGRITQLKDTMDRADVSPSEKFRLVFEAYQIENEYGRTIETAVDVLDIDGNGSARNVRILRIGRVSLVYQTDDESQVGFWNNSKRRWEALGDEYNSWISEGLRIASKQTQPDMIRAPVIRSE